MVYVTTSYLFLGAFAASNWALGTFVIISLGTWYATIYSQYRTYVLFSLSAIREICQRSLTQERLKVQHVIEQMPKRFVKPADDSTESSSK